MFAVNIFLQSLIVGVNAIIWSDNVNDVAPVWCDITSHFYIFVGVSLNACLFTITRRLFNILRLRGSLSDVSQSKKRDEIPLELLLCVGLPLLITGLYYIVQPTRYVILEEFGCRYFVYTCGVSILLVDSSTVIMQLISLFFHAPNIISSLYRHKREMSKFLKSNENTCRGDFTRPLFLSCFVLSPLLFAFPLSIILMSRSTPDSSYTFWPGWKLIHNSWEPRLLTASEWSRYGFWSLLPVKFDKWPVFACGLFFIFGLAAEARQRYRIIFWAVIKRLGVHPKLPKRKDVSAMIFQSIPVLASDLSSTEAATVDNQ